MLRSAYKITPGISHLSSPSNATTSMHDNTYTPPPVPTLCKRLHPVDGNWRGSCCGCLSDCQSVCRGCLSVCQLCFLWLYLPIFLPAKTSGERLHSFIRAAAWTSWKEPLFFYELDGLCFFITSFLLLSSVFLLHRGDHASSQDQSKTSTKTYTWYIPGFVLHIYLVQITAVFNRNKW